MLGNTIHFLDGWEDMSLQISAFSEKTHVYQTKRRMLVYVTRSAEMATTELDQFVGQIHRA
jgi:hypothetical protein